MELQKMRSFRAVPNPLRRRPFVVLALLCTGCSCGYRAFSSACRRAPPRTSPRTQLAAESGAAVWKEAYDLELERYTLLKDQLQSKGQDAGEALPEPEECAVDWEKSYQRLADCNRALEQSLRGREAEAAAEEVDEEDLPPPPPVTFEVWQAQLESAQRIELLPFYHKPVYYAVQARMPLGFTVVKEQSGRFRGAFVVQDVDPAGSLAANGAVLPGDILAAVSTTVEGQDLGMRVEDFVSSIIGGLGRYRQVLTDATYIDCEDDLEDMIQSNALLSSDTQITLVFERNSLKMPAPAEHLEPLPVPVD